MVLSSDDAGREFPTGRCDGLIERAVKSDGCEEPFAASLPAPVRARRAPDVEVEELDGGVLMWRRTVIEFSTTAEDFDLP
jgi:hypothetical protein